MSHHSTIHDNEPSTSSSRAAVFPLPIDHLLPKQPCHTRFVLLSDTHAHTFPVPDGDVLLHAGDLTERGSIKELQKTVDWICSLPHPVKIMIAGNHDYCLDEETLRESALHGYDTYKKAESIVKSPKAKAAGLIYLKDEMVEIPISIASSSTSYSSPSGSSSSASPSESSSSREQDTRKTWKVYGSPWSAAFCSMAFNIPRGDPSWALYNDIPDSTEILLTHGPPQGLLDKIKHGNRHVGCDKLLDRLQTGLPDLRLHIWGHIHEDRGVIIDENGTYSSKQSSGKRRQRTVFVNAANAGTFERPTRLWGTCKYQPMVVDLHNTKSRDYAFNDRGRQAT